MLFNSFDFGFFLVLVYALYWLLGTSRSTAQNILLLTASYVFYGLWDWRFLGLLVASSVVDFGAGLLIEKTNKPTIKKILLYGSILWNLGVLITFKYFGFFVDSFLSVIGSAPSESSFTAWEVIIPLGLSFYTFQTMSYTIDVYRDRIKPTGNLLHFLCFVSFFPQLVAGPIERAKQLLPQFERTRAFNLQQSKEGLRQILWGLFKKVLVADKLGIAVTMVFNDPESYGMLTLVYAAVLFCFQIYCDFSGYTDIAIGTAKLFGFKLSKNFNLPYFARNISDFWQRWHITLTRWFTDYVYVPLAGSAGRASSIKRFGALLFTMILVGLWHGANWTFVAFGLFSGLVLAMERLPLGPSKMTLRKWLHKAPRILSLIYFFVVSAIAAIFFRSDSIEQAFFILKRIFTLQIDTSISSLIGIKLSYLVVLLTAEIFARRYEFPLQKLEIRVPRIVRWMLYYGLIFLIIRYAEPKEAFIYFQF